MVDDVNSRFFDDYNRWIIGRIIESRDKMIDASQTMKDEAFKELFHIEMGKQKINLQIMFFLQEMKSDDPLMAMDKLIKSFKAMANDPTTLAHGKGDGGRIRYIEGCMLTIVQHMEYLSEIEESDDVEKNDNVIKFPIDKDARLRYSQGNKG